MRDGSAVQSPEARVQQQLDTLAVTSSHVTSIAAIHLYIICTWWSKWSKIQVQLFFVALYYQQKRHLSTLSWSFFSLGSRYWLVYVSWWRRGGVADYNKRPWLYFVFLTSTYCATLPPPPYYRELNLLYILKGQVNWIFLFLEIYRLHVGLLPKSKTSPFCIFDRGDTGIRKSISCYNVAGSRSNSFR